MEFDALMRLMEARRSTRRYVKGKPVEHEKVELLLKAAMAGPSACNLQPWEFIIVDEPEALATLKRNIGEHNGRTYNAPMAMIVCANTSYIPWGGSASLDCGGAILSMLLAAQALGLGAVWIGDYDGDGLREAFDIPNHVAVNSVVYFGYPAEEKTTRNQYENEAVYWQKYDPKRPHEPRVIDSKRLS